MILQVTMAPFTLSSPWWRSSVSYRDLGLYPSCHTPLFFVCSLFFFFNFLKFPIFITYCCISRSSRLDAIRERELKQLRKYQILNIISSAMWSTAPILTALATFAVYSAAYGELTPATAFTAVSLFNVLRFPLTMFPNTVTSAVEANVSVARLEQFLSSPEITGDLFCLLVFMIYWRSLGDMGGFCSRTVVFCVCFLLQDVKMTRREKLSC